MTDEQIEVAARKLQELVLKHGEVLKYEDAISELKAADASYEVQAIIYALAQNKH